MLLTEILTSQQDEVGALFQRLYAADLRSEEGRRALLLLRLRLHEHLRLEDTLLIPALEGAPDLKEALAEFHSGFERLDAMQEDFWQRWDPDGPLTGAFRLEMDFLFNLIRHRLRLTRTKLYPAYAARLVAA